MEHINQTPEETDILSNLDATINSVDSELDWKILDTPFPNAQADAILGLGEEDCEPDWNNLAQQQSDADYESGAPDPSYAL